MRQSVLRCLATVALVASSVGVSVTATRRPATPQKNLGARILFHERVTRFPKTDEVQIVVIRATVPPHGSTRWHVHLYPQASYMLSGTLILQDRKGSRIAQMRAGEAKVEPAGVILRAVNPSESVPAVIVLFQVSAPGKPAIKWHA